MKTTEVNTEMSPAVIAFVAGIRAALTDVDGLDPEQVDVHDLARRSVAEATLRAAGEGIKTWDVAAEAEAIKAAGFDYNEDPADGFDVLASLFGPLG